jgi:hypothetical protein
MDPQQQQAYAPGPAPAGNGMAVAGLVLGLLGLVLCWIPGLGWVLALLGIIFGAVGISKGNRVGRGKGMAVAGLVVGMIGLLLGIVLFVLAMKVVEEEEREMRRRLERGDVMVPDTAPAADATLDLPA